MKLNNENITIQKALKTVENPQAKVITLVQNPSNPKQARIYVDDCRFIQWYEIEANFREQVAIANGLAEMTDIVIVMEHDEWENPNYWTTSFIEYDFLKWNPAADNWWDSETRRGKAITERWNNIWA